MSPADVYILLKSSDFISHDLTPEELFQGCEFEQSDMMPELELVLRKWYPIEPSREVRCFVRATKLVGQLLPIMPVVSLKRPNSYRDFSKG